MHLIFNNSPFQWRPAGFLSLTRARWATDQSGSATRSSSTVRWSEHYNIPPHSSCIFSTFVSTSWFRPTSVWSLEFGNPISPLKIKALILILTVRIFYQRTQDGISLCSRFSTLEQFKLCRAFQSQESEHCSIPCSIAESALVLFTLSTPYQNFP